jgi:hypothetical protein
MWNMIITGDSLVAGPMPNDSGLAGQSGEPSAFGAVAQYLLGTRTHIWNGAIGGQTLTSMVALHTTQVAPHIVTTTGVVNVCVFDGVLNDQVNGVSLAGLEALLTTYAADLRSDGCNKIIFLGPESSNLWEIYSEGGVSYYYSLCAWLESNANTYFDGYVDYCIDPIMGVVSNDGGANSYANISWFLDNTHWTVNLAAYANQGPLDGGLGDSGIHQSGFIPVAQYVLGL